MYLKVPGVKNDDKYLMIMLIKYFVFKNWCVNFRILFKNFAYVY